jgi:hypothetical protein
LTVLLISLRGLPASSWLFLNEGPIGTVEPTRQDRCNVKESDRVLPEQGGRIRDVKL